MASIPHLIPSVLARTSSQEVPFPEDMGRCPCLAFFTHFSQILLKGHYLVWPMDQCWSSILSITSLDEISTNTDSKHLETVAIYFSFYIYPVLLLSQYQYILLIKVCVCGKQYTILHDLKLYKLYTACTWQILEVVVNIHYILFSNVLCCIAEDLKRKKHFPRVLALLFMDLI